MYFSELPIVVLKFLKKVTLNAEHIYTVLTCGNDYAVSARWSKDLLLHYPHCI